MSVRKVVLVPFEQYQTLIAKVDGCSKIDMPKVQSKDESIQVNKVSSSTPSEETIHNPSVLSQSVLADKKENSHLETKDDKFSPKITLKKKKKKKLKNGNAQKKDIVSKSLSFYLPPPSVGLQSGGSKLFNFESPIEENKPTFKSGNGDADIRNIKDLITKYWVK